MNDLERVRRFRIPTCGDIGDAGIRAMLDGSVVVGSSGLLILHKPAGVLKLEAHVAYVEKGQVGRTFILKKTSEHGTIIKLCPDRH